MGCLVHIAANDDLRRLILYVRNPGDESSDPWPVHGALLRTLITAVFPETCEIFAYHGGRYPSKADPQENLLERHTKESYARSFEPRPWWRTSTAWVFGKPRKCRLIRTFEAGDAPGFLKEFVLGFSSWEKARGCLYEADLAMVTAGSDTPDTADPYFFVRQENCLAFLEKLTGAADAAGLSLSITRDFARVRSMLKLGHP
ncbi:MAG TPA: hypothetical protein VG944_15820 [Fimbriimonas sp.]|nr:hypothetical protein [Fimbriimonas sp.]